MDCRLTVKDKASAIFRRRAPSRRAKGPAISPNEDLGIALQCAPHQFAIDFPRTNGRATFSATPERMSFFGTICTCRPVQLCFHCRTIRGFRPWWFQRKLLSVAGLYFIVSGARPLSAPSVT